LELAEQEHLQHLEPMVRPAMLFIVQQHLYLLLEELVAVFLLLVREDK
jgi:hypothetical protein